MKRGGRLQEVLITGFAWERFSTFDTYRWLVTYERWSHMEVWTVDFFLSVYDISQITVNVEIGFSGVIFSGLLVARVCPLLV